MKALIPVLVLALVATVSLVVTSCRSNTDHSKHVGHHHETSMDTSHGAAATAAQPLSEGNPHPGYCVVMGGKADKEKANANGELYSDYEGKRYYFCCKSCKPRFENDPEKWLASPASPKGGHHAHQH